MQRRRNQDYRSGGEDGFGVKHPEESTQTGYEGISPDCSNSLTIVEHRSTNSKKDEITDNNAENHATAEKQRDQDKEQTARKISHEKFTTTQFLAEVDTLLSSIDKPRAEKAVSGPISDDLQVKDPTQATLRKMEITN